MANESTKEQIRSWLEKSVEKAKNPDLRLEVKRIREQKAKQFVKKYGL